jgi:hypothetical protein
MVYRNEDRMARPTKGELATTETISAKLTKAERRALDGLVARRNEIARKMGYSGVNVSSYVRGLILQDVALARAHQEAGVTTVSPNPEKTTAMLSEVATRKDLADHLDDVDRELRDGGERRKSTRLK